MSSTKRVILWSAPRCVSTAFERSVRNLENSKVFHEILSQKLIATPRDAITNELVGSLFTPESALAFVTKDYEGVDVIFSKELAFPLGGNYDILTRGRFKQVQHSFLIRNPERSLESLYHGSFRPGATLEYASLKYAGWKELSELFSFVRENIEPSPVVVDADDLLDDPEGIMRSYCSAMGLKFKEGMTKWSPGPVADFECLWTGWHDNLFNSSGITRKDTRNYATAGRALPAEWREAIANLMPCYQDMCKYKIAPSQTSV